MTEKQRTTRLRLELERLQAERARQDQELALFTDELDLDPEALADAERAMRKQVAAPEAVRSEPFIPTHALRA